MISLCMIVRDEAPTVEAALRSVLGVVDEAIVLDTGSTDGTHEILARLAGEFPRLAVRRHEWRDDFSEARNAAAALAANDWILVLDGDEVLLNALEVPTGEVLDAFDADVVRFVVEGIHRDAAVERIVTPRLYRKSRCRWKYPVHNQLEGWRRLVSCGAVVRADYTREKPARLDREKILLAYHAAHPADVHAPFFLARMAASRDDWLAAEEWAAKVTLLAPQSEEHAGAWDLLSLARLRRWSPSAAATVALRALRYHPNREELWRALAAAAVAGLAEVRPNSAGLAVAACALGLPFDVARQSISDGEAIALGAAGWMPAEVRAWLGTAASLLRRGDTPEEISNRLRAEREAKLAAGHGPGVSQR